MINQGDIAWLDLDPQSGHEQKGRRPVIVVSNRDFHLLTGHKLAMVCPITNTSKANLLHVELDKQTHTTGFIMCEQAKVLDITTRNYKFIEKVPTAVLIKVLNRVQAISLLNSGQ
ncbi:MAG: type II toxin-antitoxin system PemK/MazF family toxin [Defluviitaleaceae bacterium]|nr:type II toxin-antitoxin system PemK/MazF family toxin [Defluviitaleaceae bacterium]